MRIGVYGVVALGLLTAACGTDTQQRAATGGLTGLGVGALVGGPVGAAVGTAVGAIGGWAMPEGADTLALNAFGLEHRAATGALNEAGVGPSSPGPGQAPTGQRAGMVRQAQNELHQQGLYDGPIDGIVGPKTKSGLNTYQQRHGLQQTARLDEETLRSMGLAGGSAQASGSSTPPGDLSADEIRDKLTSDGYDNVTHVQRRPNDTYTAQADRDNQTYRLRIDAHTGHVIGQRRTASTESAPAAGSSTSTSTSTGEQGTSGNANPSDQGTSGSTNPNDQSTSGSNNH
jgi:peptidoglycan hydrolase-like protein with peptidoglycan-binding domain